MSGALRRRRLEGMCDEGWVHARTVCELRSLGGLRATMADIRLILEGGGADAKRRLELS